MLDPQHWKLHRQQNTSCWARDPEIGAYNSNHITSLWHILEDSWRWVIVTSTTSLHRQQHPHHAIWPSSGSKERFCGKMAKNVLLKTFIKLFFQTPNPKTEAGTLLQRKFARFLYILFHFWLKKWFGGLGWPGSYGDTGIQTSCSGLTPVLTPISSSQFFA